MKKSYCEDEVGRFLLVGRQTPLLIQAVSTAQSVEKMVLTPGHCEILRHYRRAHHFPRDQRLRIETPECRVLANRGNPFTEDELERQTEKIRKGRLVVRDREHPSTENLIVVKAGIVDTNLLPLAKVASLVQVLQMGGSYGIEQKLWSQFVLKAGSRDVEVAWNRDEILVS